MWEVHGSKKGALPISVEKRPKGKVVTILTNVRKEPAALLTALQRYLGAGGKLVGNGMVELQGNHAARLERYLLDCPAQLKGIAGLTAATKAEAAKIAAARLEAEAAANAADSAARRTDKPRWERRDKKHEVAFAAAQLEREERNFQATGVRRRSSP